jgi:hypothetical protein
MLETALPTPAYGPGINDTRRAITTAFQTDWATGPYASVQVGYPGMPFTPPSGQPCVILTIVGGGSHQMEIVGENPFIRRTGFVQIDVSVPSESTTIDASRMLDIALAVYEGRELEYQNSGIIKFSNGTEPVWRSIQGRTIGTCRVDYRRDARRASRVTG